MWWGGRVRRTGETPDEAWAHLRADREATVARIATLTRDLGGIFDASADVATDDEHDPEGSTIAFERAQLMTLVRDARLRLDELDRSLADVAAGTYGTCERCGRPVPPERLRVRPSARTCVTCPPPT